MILLGAEVALAKLSDQTLPYLITYQEDRSSRSHPTSRRPLGMSARMTVALSSVFAVRVLLGAVL